MTGRDAACRGRSRRSSVGKEISESDPRFPSAVLGSISTQSWTRKPGWAGLTDATGRTQVGIRRALCCVQQRFSPAQVFHGENKSITRLSLFFIRFPSVSVCALLCTIRERNRQQHQQFHWKTRERNKQVDLFFLLRSSFLFCSAVCLMRCGWPALLLFLYRSLACSTLSHLATLSICR